jgi:hypothetical protein
MTNSFPVNRKVIILAIILPVAALLGYLLATPDQYSSLAFTAFVVGVLVLPIVLGWHYPLLLFSWNTAITVFFLPGQPLLWMPVAVISLGISVLAYWLNKQAGFQNIPSITGPLVFLFLVVLVTMKLTGGIGLRSLGGGTYGGKKFVFILVGIMGYFALSHRRIAPEKIKNYTALYFLPGVIALLPNLIYMAGPAFWWLYWFFPVESALYQALEDFQTTAIDARLSRVAGAPFATLAIYSYMMARYGIRGVFDLRRPWRLAIFLAAFALGLLGGFRSSLILFALTFAAQFFLEGLLRTRLFVVLLLIAVVTGALLVPFTDRLPLSVQRSLSFLPVEVDPAARQDALASIEWRLRMWDVLWPQVPLYFWLGKGYVIDPTDLYLTDQAMRHGLASDYDAAIICGDYHSGPLSVIIPFGVWGAIAFLWLLIVEVRVLYCNYRFGDPETKNLNALLLASFLARSVLFFIISGSLHSDLVAFLGLLGLSVAINGGVRVKKPAEEPLPVAAAAPEPAVA